MESTDNAYFAEVFCDGQKVQWETQGRDSNCAHGTPQMAENLYVHKSVPNKGNGISQSHRQTYWRKSFSARLRVQTVGEHRVRSEAVRSGRGGREGHCRTTYCLLRSDSSEGALTDLFSCWTWADL